MANVIVQAPSKTIGCFSNNQLKIIAMLSMLIDHIGVELFPDLESLRIIGRLALPLFAYMIAEGCYYTKNRISYLPLIATLALLCQAVFYFTTQSLYQSILVTFSLSIITIFSIDGIIKHANVFKVVLSVVMLIFVTFVAFIMPTIFSKQGFEIDYGYLDMLLPVFIYYAPNKICKLAACGLMLILLAIDIQGVQIYALLALPLLALYNGKRGTKKLKYMFYIFYPLHLVVIYLVGLFLI